MRVGAMMKLGMVTPRVAKAMVTMSCHFPLRSAATIPMGSAVSSTKTSVIRPSVAEKGKPFSIKSFTVLPVNLKLGPS